MHNLGYSDLQDPIGIWNSIDTHSWEPTHVIQDSSMHPDLPQQAAACIMRVRSISQNNIMNDVLSKRLPVASWDER